MGHINGKVILFSRISHHSIFSSKYVFFRVQNYFLSIKSGIPWGSPFSTLYCVVVPWLTNDKNSHISVNIRDTYNVFELGYCYDQVKLLFLLILKNIISIFFYNCSMRILSPVHPFVCNKVITWAINLYELVYNLQLRRMHVNGKWRYYYFWSLILNSE